jgi:hypothetical protein
VQFLTLVADRRYKYILVATGYSPILLANHSGKMTSGDLRGMEDPYGAACFFRCKLFWCVYHEGRVILVIK